MKTYEIELQRVSFITLTVEAENQIDAEGKAYEELEKRSDKDDADWDITYVQEKGFR
jgi:hypothetical protein